jgi:hypothetical protein
MATPAGTPDFGALVLPVPRICVFSWLLDSIEKHRLVREQSIEERLRLGGQGLRSYMCFIFGFCLSLPPTSSTEYVR